MMESEKKRGAENGGNGDEGRWKGNENIKMEKNDFFLG